MCVCVCVRVCVCVCVCACVCVVIQHIVSTSLQALWALANIIGNGAELRDYVLDRGIVPAILKYVHTLCI